MLNLLRPSLSFEEWRSELVLRFPNVRFVKETGAGETYGEEGSWTAATGPDMQADVVGVYVPAGNPDSFPPFCSIIMKMYIYEWQAESSTSDIDRWENSQSSQGNSSP